MPEKNGRVWYSVSKCKKCGTVRVTGKGACRLCSSEQQKAYNSTPERKLHSAKKSAEYKLVHAEELRIKRKLYNESPERKKHAKEWHKAYYPKRLDKLREKSAERAKAKEATLVAMKLQTVSFKLPLLHGVVYRITNKLNGKAYIGVTNNIKERWAAHKSAAKIEKPAPISCAIRKYGYDNFLFEIVFTMFDYMADRDYYEKLFIADEGTYSIGYNTTKGGGYRAVGRRKRKDYTGQTIKTWTIMSDADDRIGADGRADRQVNVQCICGAQAVALLSNVKGKQHIKCNCESKKQYYRKIDYTGQRFGALTVLEDAVDAPESSRIVNCLCDCGTTKEIIIQHLLGEGTKTCGCQQIFFKREVCIKGVTYYNVREAACKLNVCISTIHKWLACGRNDSRYIDPPTRNGRIKSTGPCAGHAHTEQTKLN